MWSADNSVNITWSSDLVSLVEEQAEVGEDHPQLLPAVAVLELPQEVP